MSSDFARVTYTVVEEQNVDLGLVAVSELTKTAHSAWRRTVREGAGKITITATIGDESAGVQNGPTDLRIPEIRTAAGSRASGASLRAIENNEPGTVRRIGGEDTARDAQVNAAGVPGQGGTPGGEVTRAEYLHVYCLERAPRCERRGRQHRG
jgi:hypothetical protein